MVLFRNKKGMMETIVKAIPVIILAGILIYFVVQFVEFGNKSVDREICKDSVLLKAKSKALGKPLIGEITCTTELLEIDETEEGKVKDIISKEMYDCWYQFGGEQEIDFLDDHDWGAGNNWCFVCNRIDFSEKTQEEVPEIVGIFDYLKTEPINYVEKEPKTFFNYIYSNFSENIDPQEFDYVYSTDEPFYIVFFGDKRFEWVSGDADDILTMVGGFVAGMEVGARVGMLTGAKVGGIKGAVIGAMAGGILVKAGTKTGYVRGLYIGGSEEMVERCNQ